MSLHLQRARLLFQQNRNELAEAELRQALADDPNASEPHALLALCLLRRKEWEDATREARHAIHLAPDVAYNHYVLACVLSRRHREDEAELAIQEAIRLDPFDADYFALLSSLHFDRSRWADSLAAAEQGLAIEADHVQCTNRRAMALVKLGRQAEAGRTLDVALARAPEDALSHANMGWTLLEQRQPEKAMEHFRESLRLNPNLKWARQGIVESMKARHFLYRWLLSFFFWMSRFDTRTQWMIVIGFLVGRIVLARVTQAVPALAPLYWPIVIGYLIFAILTWIASPLFNLVLRLNRFGRLALSREETIASNLLAACLIAAFLVASIPTIWSLAKGQPIDVDFLGAAIVIFALSLPVTNIFRCSEGWPRALQIVIAIGLTLLVATATGSVIFGWPFTSFLLVLSIWGLGLSTWAGMFLAGVTVKK